MKRLLITGIALAFVLSAGTAMAGSDTFQTLGTVSVDQTAYTLMTGTELASIEGKMYKATRYYTPKRQYTPKRHYKKPSYTYNGNSSTIYQSNVCAVCGNNKGGGSFNGGVIQGNSANVAQNAGNGNFATAGP